MKQKHRNRKLYSWGCSDTSGTMIADNTRRGRLAVPNKEIRCFIYAAIYSLGDYDE